jgi:hypothetical protein
MNLKSISFGLLLTSLTGPTLAWTVSADFDSGELGTKADRGGDGFSGAGGNSIYTNEQTVSGNAAKLTIEKGSTGYGRWGGGFMFPEKIGSGDTIWYQVYTYFPVGFDHYSYSEGNRLKFLRIHTKSSSGSNHGYVDFYIDRHDNPNAFKWIYEGAAQWRNVGNPEDLIVLGQWESYQMRVTFDDVPRDLGGNAEVYIWKNGTLLQHITNRKTLKTDTDYSDRALLFTYWNGGSPKTQSMYVDNITLTTETPAGFDAQGTALIPSPIPNPPAKINILEIQ